MVPALGDPAQHGHHPGCRARAAATSAASPTTSTRRTTGPRRSACEDQNTPTRPPWIDHQPPPRPCWDRGSAPGDPVRPVDRRTAAGHAVRAAPGLSHAPAQGAARRRHAGSADGAAARGLFLGPGPLGARRRWRPPRPRPRRRRRAGTPSAATSAPVRNVYAATAAGALTGAARTARPHGLRAEHHVRHACSSSTPAPTRSSDRFSTGREPQHVVPSWDLKTLWVNDDLGNDLTPIDPRTGKAGKPGAGRRPVQPVLHARRGARPGHGRAPAPHRRPRPAHDGVPALAAGAVPGDQPRRLHRRPVASSWPAASSAGSCSSSTSEATKVRKVIDLNAIKTPGATTPARGHAHARQPEAAGCAPGASAMPQDVRLTPDGRYFLAADMLRNGVWVIDAATLKVRPLPATPAWAPTASTPRGTPAALRLQPRRGQRSRSWTPRTLKQVARWKIPGGGSPDMGGVTADGTQLWLSRPLRRRGLRLRHRAPARSRTGSASTRDRTACACGPSPARSRSATPATCADARPTMR